MQKYLHIFFLIVSINLVACGGNNSNVRSYGEVGITPNYAREGITGKPYKVRGVTYHPLLSAEGFIEEGEASWYGPGFHGKLTANGEVYNQNGMTAAHKYLPLGTYVYVQNLENGKMVYLKVNDRGPFLHDRIIDLSKKAASELDLLEKGVGRVRVTVEKNPKNVQVEQKSADLEKIEPLLPKDALPFSHLIGGNVYIQLDKYSSKNAALDGVAIVNDLTLPSRIVESGRSYTLQAGPFLDASVANKILALFKIKFPSARVID